MKVHIVTGGAGFIGSNLVKRLIAQNNKVIVFDNFSTGELSNLPLEGNLLKVVNIDLKNSFEKWPKFNNIHTIFHLAANADVRGGIENRNIDFEQNVFVTKQVADYARAISAQKVVFSSSATVYGEPSIFPTPENSELIQTSIYGASKLFGEALFQAYSEYGDFEIKISRFVSWIGKGYSHGVIFDFYKKLINNSKTLEILGNGEQKKSYLDVRDGIEGIIYLSEKKEFDIFNLGNEDIMNVKTLADIVCKEMRLENVEYKFSGGERGWIGDSPFVQLNIERAKQLGWSPKISIKEGIKSTIKYLQEIDKK